MFSNSKKDAAEKQNNILREQILEVEKRNESLFKDFNTQSEYLTNLVSSSLELHSKAQVLNLQIHEISNQSNESGIEHEGNEEKREKEISVLQELNNFNNLKSQKFKPETSKAVTQGDPQAVSVQLSKRLTELNEYNKLLVSDNETLALKIQAAESKKQSLQITVLDLETKFESLQKDHSLDAKISDSLIEPVQQSESKKRVKMTRRPPKIEPWFDGRDIATTKLHELEERLKQAELSNNALKLSLDASTKEKEELKKKLDDKVSGQNRELVSLREKDKHYKENIDTVTSEAEVLRNQLKAEKKKNVANEAKIVHFEAQYNTEKDAHNAVKIENNAYKTANLTLAETSERQKEQINQQARQIGEIENTINEKDEAVRATNRENTELRRTNEQQASEISSLAQNLTQISEKSSDLEARLDIAESKGSFFQKGLKATLQIGGILAIIGGVFLSPSPVGFGLIALGIGMLGSAQEVSSKIAECIEPNKPRYLGAFQQQSMSGGQTLAANMDIDAPTPASR